MTITEACAVNVLLAFLLDESPLGAPRQGRPTIAAVDNAGATLAKKAYRALSSGYDAERWHAKWRRKTVP